MRRLAVNNNSTLDFSGYASFAREAEGEVITIYVCDDFDDLNVTDEQLMRMAKRDKKWDGRTNVYTKGKGTEEAE
jgi:hypothetical protein